VYEYDKSCITKKRYRNWYGYTSYPMCTKKWKDICIMNSYGENDNDKHKGIYVKNSWREAMLKMETTKITTINGSQSLYKEKWEL
jgi:hypothetical protein